MNNFLKWQNNKNSTGKYIFFLVIGALIFPALIPALLVFLLPQVDQLIGIPSFYHGSINIIIGLIVLLPGGLLAFWSIFAQVKLASGTPFPMLPTQKLLIVGPFQLCRNPMTLGTLLVYSAIAVMVGSFTSIFFVTLFSLTLLTYIKVIEEKELELRFGEAYLQYKKDTPFIIPIRFA